MKILKKTKILAVILAITMVLGSFSAFASNDTDGGSFYARFEGSVTYVSDNEPYVNHITVEGAEDYEIINFIITENTLFMTVEGIKPVEEISIGDELVVYFIEPFISTMIFPPQREASVFVRPTRDAAQTIFFGRFNNELVSDDNSLKLNVSEDTTILRANGTDGSDVALGGRDLVVVYTISTRSIPAQTTPELIVILNPTPEMSKELMAEAMESDGYVDFEASGPLQLDQETIEKLNAQLQEDLKNAPIFVRGEEIAAPETLVRNGVVFLPLRAIVEALGYDVFWEEETRSVALGAGIRLQIGSYEYTVGRMAPITLNNAPILVNGLTYVPMEFFGEVLGLDAGFMIEYNHAEIMISDRYWE